MSNHIFPDVLVDYKLTFDKDINKLCSKVSQCIGMRRISRLVKVIVFRNLYYTLIHSRLTYTITAFSSTTRRKESLL